MNWTKKSSHLLSALADSVAGYDHIGAHAHHFDFYAFCEHHAEERRHLVKKLRHALEAYAVHAEAHGTILGSAHRLFTDIRAALTSGNLVIIEELIRGETSLATRTDAMLDDEELPPAIHDLGREIGTHVRQSLLDLRSMRDHAHRGRGAATFNRDS